MLEYYCYLPDGMNPEKVFKTREMIEYALNASVQMEKDGNRIKIRIYHGQLPNKIKYTDYDINSPLNIPIGKGHEGMITLDMASDSHPYLLVGGNPGTGKSNFLNQVIHSIVTHYLPEQVQLVLVDLKLGVEFRDWMTQPHVFRYAFEADKVDWTLKLLDTEIRDRMNKFQEHGVKKISEYNRLKGVKPLSYLLMIIDEYAELKLHNEKQEKAVKSLLQIGRAAGLRAILATQRPTVDNISGSIKALCSDRLAFKVASKINSRVILDIDGAEQIPNIPGRAIFLTGAEFKEVQTMLYA